MGQIGDVGVPRNQALISFANCFQVESSYISFRDVFPRDYSDDVVLKLANN